MKKSQISIYLIIFVIILLFAISLLLFKEKSFLDEQKQNEIENFDTVYYYYYNCINTNLDHLFYFLSSRGGYFYEPEYIIDMTNVDETFLGVKIPLYIYNKEKYYLDTPQLENEIKKGIKSIIYSCNFNIDFTEFKVNLEIEDFDLKILFTNYSIISELNLPLEVIGQQKQKKYFEFNFLHNTNYYKLYNIATEITNEQYFLNDYFCFNCIDEISKKNNVNINFIETYDDEKNIFIYILEEEINPELKFIFGHYFNNSII
jgi:hypothetical protein